nr:MAG TPA_asm: hypothetical protein [Caudoviricetes sp.]
MYICYRVRYFPGCFEIFVSPPHPSCSSGIRAFGPGPDIHKAWVCGHIGFWRS